MVGMNTHKKAIVITGLIVIIIATVIFNIWHFYKQPAQVKSPPTPDVVILDEGEQVQVQAMMKAPPQELSDKDKKALEAKSKASTGGLSEEEKAALSKYLNK